MRSLPHQPLPARAALILGAACAWLMLPGCCLTQTLTFDDNPCAPHVEVFRGIVGYMPGANALQDELADRGIASTVTYCELWRDGVERIAERHAARPCEPVVIIGYSFGGRAALRAARELADRGIEIDALILLDGWPGDIPGNVRYCFDVYRSQPPGGWAVLDGTPRDAECTSTCVVHHDLRLDGDVDGYHGYNHLTYTSSPAVLSLLADQTAAVFACHRK